MLFLFSSVPHFDTTGLYLCKEKHNTMDKYLIKIYQIGNFIAAQASDDVPNIGQKLFDIFKASFQVNCTRRCCAIWPLMFAIKEELDAFEKSSELLGITSEVLIDFRKRLNLLGSYESWESADIFIDCAWIMFGLVWT